MKLKYSNIKITNSMYLLNIVANLLELMPKLPGLERENIVSGIRMDVT